ncbi:hypothetical protein [Dokdonia sp.]|uniref:hypothetical protein n=1 Tax=Dokdonia sp. TaxID=2024995 RepID=UPI003262F82E
MHITKVNNVTIMDQEYLESFVASISKSASETAIRVFTEQQQKREILTTSQVAKEMRKTTATIINWIKEGVRGIKLKAKANGKSYEITRLDLIEFNNKRNI